MLNTNVLVLNQSYEPVGICNVKRALVMLFLGKSDLVEKHTDLIRSALAAFPVPSIIRLKRFIAIPHKKIHLTRKNILKRDNYTCQYCQRSGMPMTIDHILPKDKGGSYSWENLTCACVICNTKKGNRTPERAGLNLMSRPKKPNNIVFIKDMIGISDDRWRPYLFL